MKKLFLMIVGMLSAGCLMAQSVVETVHLKNGGLVKGEIIEQVPGLSLKIKTKDGNIFVYKMDEVERITKEQKSYSEAKAHKGLDFSVNAGYDANTKGGGGAIAAELELGKRFSDTFYWGFGVGGNFSTTSGGGAAIPITTNVKTYFPLGNSSIEPFAMLKAGYFVNTENTDINGFLLGIMPGIQFGVSNTLDMNLGVGYMHSIWDGGNGGAITMRMGFVFHNSPSHVKKSLLPSKDHGLQLTVEGVLNFDRESSGGLSGILSYKLSKTLMFGVGYEWGCPYLKGIELEKHRILGRLQYRTSDHRFAPIISVDGGYKIHSILHDPAEYFHNEYEAPTKSGYFVAPAIGLSLRASRNSYVELRGGYNIESGIDAREGINDDISMSGAFVKLGFTRTF